MQKIGSCDFSELPQEYRDLFEAGDIHLAAGQFFPYKPSGVAIPMAIIPGALYLVFGVGLIFMLPYYFLQDTARLSRLLDGLTAGVFPFLVTLAIFGVLIWGIYFTLSNGLKAVAAAIIAIDAKRQAEVGKHHYGLLLDEKHLVLQHGEEFDDYTCAFLPKNAITNSFATQIWVEGTKHRIKHDVVKIHFINEQGYADTLVVREYFSTTAAEMAEQIQQWHPVSAQASITNTQMKD